jgi:hypothetical protein
LNQPAAASGPAGNRFSAINNIIRIIIIMQENSKEKDGSAAVEKLFLGAQETYHESKKRTEEESKVFQKTEFFRMDRFGVYRLRVLRPLLPTGTAASNVKVTNIRYINCRWNWKDRQAGKDRRRCTSPFP